MPYCELRDIRMYYEIAGDGPETILFLHGLGADGESWALQRPAFVADYRVVTVDVRGHGRSSRPPGPYSVPGFAADVVGLLDALGLTAVHVVGLSMGGMIGFELGVNHPQRVRSLVICNAGPDLVARTWRERLQLWQRKLWLNLFPLPRVGAAIGGRLFPDPEQAPLLARLWRPSSRTIRGHTVRRSTRWWGGACRIGWGNWRCQCW
jgi:3-oxoadipate enol-lactonase